MTGSSVLQGEHYKRACAIVDSLELERTVVDKLAEALRSRFGQRLGSAHAAAGARGLDDYTSQGHGAANDIQAFLGELSATWPAELRAYLLRHWRQWVVPRQHAQQPAPQQTHRPAPQQPPSPGAQRKGQQQEQQQQQQQQQQQEQQWQRQQEWPQWQRPDPADLAKAAYADVLARQAALRERLPQARGDADALAEASRRAPDADDERGPAPGGDDALQFTVWGPERLLPDQDFLLDLWAHTEAQQSKVQFIASRMNQVATGQAGGARAAPGTHLTVRLTCPVLLIEQDLQLLTWTGTETSVSFRCRLNRDAYAAGGWISGHFEVRAGGLCLNRLPIMLRLAPMQQQQQQQQIQQPQRQQQLLQDPQPAAPPQAGPAIARREWTTTRAPKTGFASYSSEDRVDVMRCVEGLRKGGVDVKTDHLLLRSGDEWERMLMAYIRMSDVLYLFWSRSAAASEWVDREWRYGVQEKGVGFIDPFPLESPQLAPPPRELAHLHFDSLYLNCINSERFIQAQLAGAPRDSGGP